MSPEAVKRAVLLLLSLVD